MLRWIWIPLSLVAGVMAWPCVAQDKSLDLRRDRAVRPAPTQEGSMAVVTPTPEMWFYDQERIRLDDPKMAVRRRAEQRAQHRQDRLASQQWYGISNSRPAVSATPEFGGYSPHWASNTYDSLRWRPAAAPLVVLRPITDRY
jgi:hypothetical protein